MAVDGEALLRSLEVQTEDAARHQLEALQSILQRNGGVGYLRPYLGGCESPVDPETYRRSAPLSCYDDYADQINRMADGPPDDGGGAVLSVEPLVCFFYSSGTSSAKPKLIPYFDSALSRAASYTAHQGSAAVLQRLFPRRPTINKTLWFVYAGNVTSTKGGFKAMAASAFPIHSNKSGSSKFLSMSVSPREVILGSDLDAQMYCHLLCGLRSFDLVDNISAPYAVGLVRALSLLESKWEKLCDDLENGTPSIEISDLEMKKSVTELLGGPQPEVSSRVRSILKEGLRDAILIKLWPNIRYIKCVTTGSMSPYYRKLKQYAGAVPILGGDYFASECCVGINLDITQPPENTRYVLLPTGAYFEFLPYIPSECGFSSEETVDVSGVELGKTYEVVVTTYRGFYRYRLGDIVRIVGFHNSSPELEFVMRSPKSPHDLIFVMRSPKSPHDLISERDLISSMESLRASFENHMEAEITEYAGFLDSKRFKVFMEVKEGFTEKNVVLPGLRDSLEDSLGGIYKVQRDRGELEPLSIYVVRPGSFDRLLILATERGAPASQYKHPKIIRNREVADFLEGATLTAI